MKNFTFLICLLFSISCFSQISVGPTHVGKSKEFDDGVLEKFKGTKTVFVLPNTLDEDEYLKILKDSWTVTPFELVDLDDFKIEDYLNGDYSIAQLESVSRLSKKGYFSLYVFVDIQIFDVEKILEKQNKLSPKQWNKKKHSIVHQNSSNIARFYIYPKDDFLEEILKEKLNKVPGSLYNDDKLFNYKLGYLKNYFQKVNNLLVNDQTYWMYENDDLPELKSLESNKLYIPSYMAVKYNGMKWKDSDADGENLEEILKTYDYEYEIIEDDELNQKILDKNDIYYLRYVRTNSERFLQVINAKSGEIVYRDYITGLSFNIKSKDIKELNKRITMDSK